MVFSSYAFLFAFLPIVLLGYHAMPGPPAVRNRLQIWWLTVASYFFYGWSGAWLCGWILVSTAIDLFAGWGIAGARRPAARRYLPTVRRWLAPATADTPDAEVLLLGDSNAEAHDRVVPRLVQAATGAGVDARFVPTTFTSLAQVEQARGKGGGRLLLIVLGERAFATEW